MKTQKDMTHKQSIRGKSKMTENKTQKSITKVGTILLSSFIFLRPKYSSSLRRLGLLPILLLMLWHSAFAQAPPNPSAANGYQGVPASYGGDVNIYNGNVQFNLPLVTVGGRGEAGFTIMANVTQKGWHYDMRRELQYCPVPSVSELCVYKNIYTPVAGLSAPYLNAELTAGKMMVMHSGKYEPTGGSCPGSQSAFYKRLTTIIFAMPGGSSMTLYDRLNDGKIMDGSQCGTNNGPNRGTIFESRDGSQLTFISDTGIEDKWTTSSEWANGTLYFKNGVKYRIDNGNVTKITDRNGNYISFVYNDPNVFQHPNSGYVATDSMGRTVTVSTDANTRISSVTTRRQNGVTRTFKVYTGGALRGDLTPLTWQQAFPSFNGVQTWTGSSFPGGTVSKIELPDGRTYNFQYGQYGELARVELPTGAAFEYDSTTTTFASPDNADPRYAKAYVYSTISAKRVYDNGGTGASYTNKTTYTASGAVRQVREYEVGAATPTSRADHFFTGDSMAAITSSDPLYRESVLNGTEYQTDIYTGDGAQLLRRVANTWQVRTTAVDGDYKDPRITQTTTTLADTNQVAASTFSYDNFNNLTDTYEYDYGIGAAGTFLRRSHTDYLTDPNYTDYTGASLKSLPIQTWISSDVSGTNIVLRSQIEYDNYSVNPLVARTNVVGHDTGNYSATKTNRGNPTKITSYANAANQTGAVSVPSQYDILGNVVMTKDGNGNPTTFNYADNFGVPDGEARTNSVPPNLNGQSTFAFATSATNPQGWTTYAQFDYFTGAGVDAEDLNGNVSSVFYNDLLDRPTQTITANNTALRRQTTIIYDDLNRRGQSTSDLFAFGDNLAKKETFYDGLGRTIENRTYRDGTYVTAKKEFDSLGRVKRITNPYKPTETVVWTTINYDTLNRQINTISPDGATVTISYSGNTKTVTDQAGKQRKGISDALGRMIRVIEDPNGQNLATDYIFDPSGNLHQTIQGEQNRYFMYDSLNRLVRAKQPEQDANLSLAITDPVTGNGQWSVAYSYDNNGNLISTTNARGISVSGTYDNLNRLMLRDYSDTTPDVLFKYDGAGANIPFSRGQLTEVNSSISTTKNTTFDNFGRVKSSQQITNGVTYNFPDYSYNLAGDLVSQVYPSGRVVTNQFETDGDLAQVNGTFAGAGKTYVGNFSYTSAGAIGAMQLGNGRWETAQFNNRLQVTQIGLGTASSSQDLLKLNYDYGTTDNNGSLKAQQITIQGQFVANQSYTYDSLNRLKSSEEAINSQLMWKQTFQYDRYGNRKFDVTQTTTLGSCPANVCNPDISTANNRLIGFGYDQAGNVTQDTENKLFSYDAENRQTEVRNASNQVVGQYLYDGNGKRVRKITAQESTTFVYDASGMMVAEYLVTASVTQVPQTNYLTTDALGSPRVITDQAGNVISRHDYMAFGEEIYRSNNGSDSHRKKYTGYERDIESALDYAQARYYNSRNGRFTSVDPLIASATIRNPQTFNRYSYVLNSPYKFTDPLGLAASSPDIYARAKSGILTAKDMATIRWNIANRTPLGLWILSNTGINSQSQQSQAPNQPAEAQQTGEQENTSQQSQDDVIVFNANWSIVNAKGEVVPVSPEVDALLDEALSKMATNIVNAMSAYQNLVDNPGESTTLSFMIGLSGGLDIGARKVGGNVGAEGQFTFTTQYKSGDEIIRGVKNANDKLQSVLVGKLLNMSSPIKIDGPAVNLGKIESVRPYANIAANFGGLVRGEANKAARSHYNLVFPQRKSLFTEYSYPHKFNSDH